MAHIAVERELAHDQNFSSDIGERQIHLVVFIPEHAEPQNLFGKLPAFFRRILRRNAEKDQKAPPDLAVDLAVNRNRRGIDPRNNSLHKTTLSFRAPDRAHTRDTAQARYDVLQFREIVHLKDQTHKRPSASDRAGGHLVHAEPQAR